MKKRHIWVALLVSLLGWLVLTMPLAVALRWLMPSVPGLTYDGIDGTVWRGRIAAVGLRGADFGAASLALSPWSLLTGRLALDLSLRGGAVGGDAVLIRGFEGGALAQDARIMVDLARLPILAPITGALAIDIARAGFNGARCIAEGGSLKAYDVAVLLSDKAWPVGDLKGALACEDALLQAKMEGPVGAQNLTIALGLAADLSYRLAIQADSVDPQVVPALEMIGFKQDGGRYEWVQHGGGTP